MVKKALKSNVTTNTSGYTVDSFLLTDVKGNTATVEPETDLTEFKDLLDDVSVSSALNKKVNLILSRGYKIFYSNENKVNQNAQRNLLRYVGFDDYLRQYIKNTEFYGMSFTEIRKEKRALRDKLIRVPYDLFVLETPTMYALTDSQGHGELKGFKQRLGDKDEHIFKKEDIFFTRVNPFDTSIYTNKNLQELKRLISYRRVWEDMLYHNTSNNKFSDYWYADADKQISTSQMQEIMKNYKQHRLNPNTEYVSVGLERKVHTDFNFVEQIQKIIQFYDNKIYEYFDIDSTQLAGHNESDGRSAIDVLTNAITFESIVERQNFYAYQLNEILFPMLGIKARIIFNKPFRTPTKDLIENALKLKALNLSNDVISDYLRLGELPDELEFVSEEPSKNSRDSITNQTSESRMPRDKSMTTRKIGEDSTTRQNQLES